MIRKDGVRIYPKKQRTRNVSRVRVKVNEAVAKKEFYSLGNFHSVDGTYKSNFVDYINKMDADKVEVVFFLPPYHPEAYDYLISTCKYRIIVEVEKFLKSFAGKRNIQIIGSYNPRLLDLTEGYFYDAMHLKKSGIDKIFVTNKALMTREKN